MKRFIWLCCVWVVRIVMAPRNMKVSRIKTIYYNIFGGFTSDQIALYNINPKNKKEYLSEFDWYKSRKINGKYDYLLNNKVKFSESVKPYISTPEIYLIKKNGIYQNTDYHVINENDALNIIKNNKSVFLKPISKGKGIGVHRIDYKNKKIYIDLVEKDENDLLKLLNAKDNYFLSQTIKQAKYLDDIYAETSNTIRIITVRKENKVEVLYAVQRFGDKNSIPVDNGSKGGLVAKIDLKTGVLSEAHRIKSKDIYETHPDSQAIIKGTIIPNFNLIKKKVVETMKKLPELKFIAWDLLVTDNDVYVIEANSSSGVNIIQVFGGQRQGPLGAFYRLHKIIK